MTAAAFDASPRASLDEARRQPWAVRCLARIGLSPADALLGAAAVLFGIGSLAYPLGHDQGVHFYVGREWLHGGLPYRDAFDYKPPGIYAIYAAVIALFGEHAWPIRLAELACTPLLGAGCAALLHERREPAKGLCFLLGSFFYYGFFCFWDTAQCEFWCALFFTGAIAVALRSQRPFAGAIGAGLLSACALLLKTPAASFVAVAGVIVLRRHGWRALGVFLAAVAGPWVAVLVYFQVRGGLPALREALVDATVAYVLGAKRVHSSADVVRETAAAFQWFNPYATLALGAIGVAALCDIADRSFARLSRYAMPLAMTLAAFAAVAGQLKFYRYHCVLFVPGLTVGVAEAIADLRRTVSRMHLAWPLGALALVYPLSGEPARAWANGTAWFLRRATGVGVETPSDVTFAIPPPLTYDWRESTRVGEWLRGHTSPDERVLVRGFFPEIYAVAGRRAPTRFFWTVPLTDLARTYARERWLAEDRASLQENPPRFVVTLTAARSGPDSAASFPGYERAADFGRLTILQRQQPDTETTELGRGDR